MLENSCKNCAYCSKIPTRITSDLFGASKAWGECQVKNLGFLIDWQHRDSQVCDFWTSIKNGYEANLFEMAAKAAEEEE